MYINLFSIGLTPGEDCVAAVTASTCIESQVFPGIVFQGGQRILLNEEGRDYIIDNLLKGEDVGIQVGRYSSVVPSNNFEKFYTQLNFRS